MNFFDVIKPNDVGYLVTIAFYANKKTLMLTLRIYHKI